MPGKRTKLRPDPFHDFVDKSSNVRVQRRDKRKPGHPLVLSVVSINVRNPRGVKLVLRGYRLETVG